GAWVDVLAAAGVAVAPLAPANCGFEVDWSPHLAAKHAGAPLKPVVAHWTGADGEARALQGECVLAAYGIEGSLVYALSADLRERIARDGHAVLQLDLAPGRTRERLAADLARPRGRRSVAEHLRRAAGIDGAKAALLREVLGAEGLQDPARVAAAAKRLPLRLRAPRPLAEAISSAGGVPLEALDAGLMLRDRPGTFAAGEMLDWEAPTGGYLLTACFASAQVAADGVLRWLGRAGCRRAPRMRHAVGPDAAEDPDDPTPVSGPGGHRPGPGHGGLRAQPFARARCRRPGRAPSAGGPRRRRAPRGVCRADQRTLLAGPRGRRGSGPDRAGGGRAPLAGGERPRRRRRAHRARARRGRGDHRDPAARAVRGQHVGRGDPARGEIGRAFV